MASGWFDAFRVNGGPTFYPESNKTAVTTDVTALTVYVVFATLSLAFFVIMPGIKREKTTTLALVMLTLFMGGTNLAVICSCDWHVGEVEISSAYRSFSNEKFQGKIGVYVGLYQVNVTLITRKEDMAYNEQFVFYERPDQLKDEFKNGLKKGLPYPILTVAEYLAQDAGSFSWGRNYRRAGYYCCFFLWFSFGLWLLMNIMIVQIPRYGAYVMTLSGIVTIFSDFIYWLLLPPYAMRIPFEGVFLELRLGSCFWLAMLNGILCIILGIGIIIFDVRNPDKFSTILEIDYETPFDRNTIIQDSQQTKIKKKDGTSGPQSNDHGSIWKRFSRRFSKKQEENRTTDQYDYYYTDGISSPWRYMDLVSKEVKDDAKVFNLSGVQTPYKTQDIEEVLGKPEEKGEFCMNFEFTPSKSENTESKE